jgi:putative peptide zinc metalloprotease protein
VSITSQRSGFIAAARPEEGAAALAARFGAPSERPCVRKDLVIRRLVQMGQVVYVVKNARANAYYNFDEGDMVLIRLFDGTRTRHQILAAYQAEFPNETVEMSVVLDYYEMLRRYDLLEQSAAERHLATLAGLKTARQRAAQAKAEGFDIFFLLFHVLDPDKFLNRTAKYVRWLWSPPAVAFGLLCFAWSFGVIALHWAAIWGGTTELYAFLRKPLLDVIQFFFILTMIGCVHEFAHAYVTKFYGGEVHDIGLALLYFTPAFYCDTTDSILFENKWHSLWVTLAGIYIEAWMCFFAVVLWVVSYPDTLLNELAFKTILFTGVSSVFFNINPLIKIDGYHALSGLLEMPELREESFAYIGAWLQRHVLRLPVEVPDASRRKRRIYWIYGLLALAYIGVIMAFIGGLFFNLYHKYFPNFAGALLVVTMYRMFRKRVRLLTRTSRLFYLDKKEILMSRRARKPTLVAAALIGLIVFVPWGRRSIESPIVLKPLTTVRLEAPEDAIVSEVLKREGDAVVAGEPVFRLASPFTAAESTVLATERDRLKKGANRARASAEPAAVLHSEQQAGSLEAALRSVRSRDERLQVRSPIDGRILTPYVEQLRGRAFRSGGVLAEVGDVHTVMAELPVTERLLDDLEPGSPVRALFPRSLRPARGTIASISAATLQQPKTSSGGTEPAAPSSHPERFVVRAVFENSDGGLLPGMAGQAKIYGRHASYASRTWRVLKRWVQSVVW